jgi:hypothetical protein
MPSLKNREGAPMSAKFQLSSCLTKNILHLHLLGEFDGSAACELIKRIEEDGSGAARILIDTTGLRSIHPFGKTVFQNRIGSLSRKLFGLTFVGKYKHQFES